MKIIALSGKAGSGKDTFYSIAKEVLPNCQRFAFGDYLKEIAMVCGWDGKKNEFGRHLLQSVGTIMRNKDKDFFVKKLHDDLKQSTCDVAIITDCRYLNEINSFNQCTTIRIISNRKSKLNKEQNKHDSETELNNYEFDYVITNNGSIEEYKKEVLRCLSNV